MPQTGSKSYKSKTDGVFQASAIVQVSSPMSVAQVVAGRLPPQNIEAEISTLGALLLDPEAIIKVSDFLDPEDFYRPEHGAIYAAMLSLTEKRTPIDLVTVADELTRLKQLEEVGGPAKLAALVSAVATASNVQYYGQIVREKAMLRRLIHAAARISDLGFQTEVDSTAVMDQAEQALFQVTQRFLKQNFTPVRSILADSFERLDALSRQKGAIRGVSTGYKVVDNILGGLQNSDLIIIAARPSMGKCVVGDTKVINPNTGELKTIEQIYKEKKTLLLTLRSDWCFGETAPTEYIYDGFKPAYRVRTASGREIEVTLTHPFLTIEGWQPLEILKVGNRIATAKNIEVFGKEAMPYHQVVSLAYFLTDGGLTNSSPRFTNDNSRIIADFKACIQAFSNHLKVKEENSHGTRTSSYSAARLKSLIPNLPEPKYFYRQNPVKIFLKEHNIWGKLATAKTIPDSIYKLNKADLAIFINRMFSCDGTACLSHSHGTVLAEISYCSAAKDIVNGLQHLLLRFGILSTIKQRKIKYKGGYNTAYELELHGKEDILRFANEIGIYGKEEALEKVVNEVANHISGWTQDTLPIEIWSLILKAKGELSWREVYKRMGKLGAYNIHANRRSPRRETVNQLAKVLNSLELASIANSEIYWDKIVSIEPTGLKPVYDLVVPVTHSFVANDILVHNTAFALNIAEHAAIVQKKTVGIFSLEMSKEQLVDRLISSIGQIDSWKLRNGQLSDQDFRNLNEAYGKLAETNLFIDDMPSATVMEVRAKARRLRVEHGLDMVIIDYLQLMQGSSYSGDNRVQEVSEISRSLKALAKELNCPVIALSQLSRAVESRPDKRPLLSDLRESGCLSGDSLISIADGEMTPIKDLVGKSGLKVWSLDGTGKLIQQEVSKVFSSGRKKVFELKMRSGRSIQASANHKFKIYDGWQRLDQLKVGQKVALPRLYPENIVNNNKYSDDLLIFLAHMIGDGCFVKGQPVHYTSNDLNNISAVSQAAEAEFGIKTRIVPQESWYHLYLPSPYQTARNRRHPFIKWLLSEGLDLAHSHEKRLPVSLFNCSGRQIKLFLKHIWATDGCISMTNVRRGISTYYATNSDLLAKQIQHLLLGIGIQSTFREVAQVKQGRVYKSSYHVEIQGKDNQTRFLEQVGCYGKRGLIVIRCLEHLKSIKSNPNTDTFGKEIWESMVIPMKKIANLSWRDIQQRMGMSYCGSTLFKHGLSRERMGRLAEVFPNSILSQLANSDIYWDEITSITPMAVEEVYDMTVTGTHNFIANDIIVHNSIEQDSDVVMFLYREDYYHKEEQSNIMEILVRKHRNGPTGDAKVLARLQFSRFENIDTTHTANN